MLEQHVGLPLPSECCLLKLYTKEFLLKQLRDQHGVAVITMHLGQQALELRHLKRRQYETLKVKMEIL